MTQFDGHFWVESDDGTIHDPWFAGYSFICKLRGLTHTRAYIEAPPLVSKLMVKKLDRDYIQILGGEGPKDEDIESFLSTWDATENQCYINALAIQRKVGGRVVFGSMGFKRLDGSVFYEFGGEKYMTLKDFLQIQ